MRENYFWHKVHSLTGIVPIGFYMVQHLTLNSFSLAGPEKFNAVIRFFAGVPEHILLALEVLAIWLPLAFHAVYGVFIAARADHNYTQAAYRYRENRYFFLQRMSGIAAFLFLMFHVATTTVALRMSGGDHKIIEYAAWNGRLVAGGTYWVLAVYLVGVLACTYHLSYGIWNFCIRWGITVSERAQQSVARFAFLCFVAFTLLGYAALLGFLRPALQEEKAPIQARAHSSLVGA